MPRPVDAAMAADRPEKVTVRDIWVREVQRLAGTQATTEVPLYLTLSGAEGRDIARLVDAGLVRLNEVGGIATEDQGQIVAVESNNMAVLQLQRRYPGLRILKTPIESVLRGYGPMRWPQGEEEKFCRARVVNLDLNAPLTSDSANGQTTFPILSLVSKIAQLHAVPPQPEWSLLLTLHGEVTFDVATCGAIARFLQENFQLEPAFGAAARQFLGPALSAMLVSGAPPALSTIPWAQQQQVLMLFIPKKVSQLVCDQGWMVTTSANLRYGGAAGTAPMVTFVIVFTWDVRASVTPLDLYRDSLNHVLEGVGYIDPSGHLS